MIPGINTILTTDLEVVTQPNKSHRLDMDSKRIQGTCDGLAEVKQAIYKILNTERYQHEIYSWDYGVELQDLIGQPVSYACSEIQRRITEALLQDDRITAVTNFEFNTVKKHEVVCTFVVHTTFGNVETERVVNV